MKLITDFSVPGKRWMLIYFFQTWYEIILYKLLCTRASLYFVKLLNNSIFSKFNVVRQKSYLFCNFPSFVCNNTVFFLLQRKKTDTEQDGDMMTFSWYDISKKLSNFT